MASSSAVVVRANSNSFQKPFNGGKHFNGRKQFARPASGGQSSKSPPAEHEILFQKYFKSVGPRTYAAQIKKAGNGNHYLVLTEGKRDAKTGEIKKCRVFVYSEDFANFFNLLKEVADFNRKSPVPEKVARKQSQNWKKQPAEATAPVRPPAASQVRK